MLQGQRLFLAAWLSLVCSLLLKSLFGPYGPGVQNLLLSYQQQLDQRLDELEQENIKLTNYYQALQNSAEEIKLAARRLGYFDSREVPVKVLEGPDFDSPSLVSDLSVVPPLEPVANLDIFFRLAGLVFFLFFYFILYFTAQRVGGKKKVPLAFNVPSLIQETSFYNKKQDSALKLPSIRHYHEYFSKDSSVTK